MFALPYAFQQGGLVVGLLGLVLVAAWNAFMCRCLLQCYAVLFRRGASMAHDKSLFSAVARHSLGLVGVRLLDFSLLFTLLGGCATYQITAGQLLDAAGLSIVSNPERNKTVWVLICACMIWPLTLPRSLRWLSGTASIALVWLFISFVIVFMDGASPTTAKEVEKYKSQDTTGSRAVLLVAS